MSVYWASVFRRLCGREGQRESGYCGNQDSRDCDPARTNAPGEADRQPTHRFQPQTVDPTCGPVPMELISIFWVSGLTSGNRGIGPPIPNTFKNLSA